MEKQAGEH